MPQPHRDFCKDCRFGIGTGANRLRHQHRFRLSGTDEDRPGQIGGTSAESHPFPCQRHRSPAGRWSGEADPGAQTEQPDPRIFRNPHENRGIPAGPSGSRCPALHSCQGFRWSFRRSCTAGTPEHGFAWRRRGADRWRIHCRLGTLEKTGAGTFGTAAEGRAGPAQRDPGFHRPGIAWTVCRRGLPRILDRRGLPECRSQLKQLQSF